MKQLLLESAVNCINPEHTFLDDFEYIMMCSRLPEEHLEYVLKPLAMYHVRRISLESINRPWQCEVDVVSDQQVVNRDLRSIVSNVKNMKLTEQICSWLLNKKNFREQQLPDSTLLGFSYPGSHGKRNGLCHFRLFTLPIREEIIDLNCYEEIGSKEWFLQNFVSLMWRKYCLFFIVRYVKHL